MLLRSPWLKTSGACANRIRTARNPHTGLNSHDPIRNTSTNDKAGDYRGLATGWSEPGLIVAHLCVSDAIIEASARSLDRGGVVVYGTILGSPDRATRNEDLTALLRWALTR